jgi:hypothetical protein
MKEPDIEGIANHDGPESCGAARKDGVEALTGVHASWVLSRETAYSRMPTRLSARQATRSGRQREAWIDPARSRDPMRAWNLLAREPGDPLLTWSTG